MIGNIITSVITNRFTKLQLSLSVLANDKKLIDHLHQYGITSTYQEYRRFKVSAAVSSENKRNQIEAKNGLVQVIADNFDAHIHSQNGLKETHCMATIITQPKKKTQDSQWTAIPRLKQEELKNVSLKEPDITYYKGNKNPEMPGSFCKFQVLPLRVLCHQQITLAKSRADDMLFIKSCLTSDLSPDFNGFNCRQMRESGVSPKPKTNVTFLPLIDRTPSDPSTILIVMHEAEKKAIQACQKYSSYTGSTTIQSGFRRSLVRLLEMEPLDSKTRWDALAHEFYWLCRCSYGKQWSCSLA